MANKKFKIKKGDKVQVLAGRDKGKTGEVLKVLTERDRVLVSGVQMVKRHQRATQLGQPAGIIQKEASIHISNVALLDPKENKPTRVGYKILKDGKKERVAKRSGEVVAS